VLPPGKAPAPAEPRWPPNPQAWAAWRNDDAADPDGCAAGIPPPLPPPPPAGAVTPCSFRHCRNDEFCDEPAPDEPCEELEPDVLAWCEPHPASVATANTAMAAMVTGPVGRAARRAAARRRDRLIKSGLPCCERAVRAAAPGQGWCPA
jgi:hypothetical protein